MGARASFLAMKIALLRAIQHLLLALYSDARRNHGTPGIYVHVMGLFSKVIQDTQSADTLSSSGQLSIGVGTLGGGAPLASGATPSLS